MTRFPTQCARKILQIDRPSASDHVRSRQDRKQRSDSFVPFQVQWHFTVFNVTPRHLPDLSCTPHGSPSWIDSVTARPKRRNRVYPLEETRKFRFRVYVYANVEDDGGRVSSLSASHSILRSNSRAPQSTTRVRCLLLL